ncbi:MAG: hypothetical protein PF483_16525, partial [Halothiobacillus sp.]|nr:hypothetical protein [Halothiobacillus sp.]
MVKKRGVGLGLVLFGVGMLIWTFVGHHYRPPIEEQTATWHDGVRQYTFERAPTDTFDAEMYKKTRSIKD